MKCLLSNLAYLFCILTGVNCFADCGCAAMETRYIACPKTYITPNQIDFSENSIFVQVNGVIIQTEGIHADSKGIFFDSAVEDCGFGQWRCTRKLKGSLHM